MKNIKYILGFLFVAGLSASSNKDIALANRAEEAWELQNAENIIEAANVASAKEALRAQGAYEFDRYMDLQDQYVLAQNALKAQEDKNIDLQSLRSARDSMKQPLLDLEDARVDIFKNIIVTPEVQKAERTRGFFNKWFRTSDVDRLNRIQNRRAATEQYYNGSKKKAVYDFMDDARYVTKREARNTYRKGLDKANQFGVYVNNATGQRAGRIGNGVETFLARINPMGWDIFGSKAKQFKAKRQASADALHTATQRLLRVDNLEDAQELEAIIKDYIAPEITALNDKDLQAQVVRSLELAKHIRDDALAEYIKGRDQLDGLAEHYLDGQQQPGDYVAPFWKTFNKYKRRQNEASQVPASKAIVLDTQSTEAPVVPNVKDHVFMWPGISSKDAIVKFLQNKSLVRQFAQYIGQPLNEYVENINNSIQDSAAAAIEKVLPTTENIPLDSKLQAMSEDQINAEREKLSKAQDKFAFIDWDPIAFAEYKRLSDEIRRRNGESLSAGIRRSIQPTRKSIGLPQDHSFSELSPLVSPPKGSGQLDGLAKHYLNGEQQSGGFVGPFMDVLNKHRPKQNVVPVAVVEPTQELVEDAAPVLDQPVSVVKKGVDQYVKPFKNALNKYKPTQNVVPVAVVAEPTQELVEVAAPVLNQPASVATEGDDDDLFDYEPLNA